MVVLLFPYDLSFKVNLEVKGQIYENHQISPLLVKLELWDVLHTNRKVGSRNPTVASLFPYDLSFKVKLEVKGQTYENHQISPLLIKIELWDVLLIGKWGQEIQWWSYFFPTTLPSRWTWRSKGQIHENHQISPLLFKLELWDVLQTNRKVGSRNPIVVFLFTYDLPFKVNLKVEGQTYKNHQISPLLFKLEVWDVLHTNRKVGSRNPIVVLLFPYDLPFKVNLKVEGQTYEKFKIIKCILYYSS